MFMIDVYPTLGLKALRIGYDDLGDRQQHQPARSLSCTDE